MENQVWSHLKCKLPNCHMVCGGKDAGDSRWVIFLEAGGGYGSLQGGSESQGGADSLSGHGGSGVSMAIAFGLATIAMDMCPSPKIFLDKSIKPGERSGGAGSGGHSGGAGTWGRSLGAGTWGYSWGAGTGADLRGVSTGADLHGAGTGGMGPGEAGTRGCCRGVCSGARLQRIPSYATSTQRGTWMAAGSGRQAWAANGSGLAWAANGTFS